MYDVLIDTDVLIWYLRGNQRAKELIHSMNGFCISCVTHIELVQGMRNKEELRLFQKTMNSWSVKTIFINEQISAKALFYVEEYHLSHSMFLSDALIASTATTNGTKLVTANDKHYRFIKELEVKSFRP